MSNTIKIYQEQKKQALQNALHNFGIPSKNFI